MEDVVDIAACLSDGGVVAQVVFEELEAVEEVSEVLAVAGLEVIQAADYISVRREGFYELFGKVGSDKAGTAGH